MTDDTLELSIPIDETHQVCYEELDEVGIPVEGTVAGLVRRNVENALHEILQREKYQ